MTTAEAAAPESRTFEADVAKLLHLMVHSVYSDKDVFLRELISNAADACEKLRYEAITTPALLGEDARPRITLAIDAEGGRLTVEDNGIGMSRDEMVEALGTIARSGTKAFMERIEAAAGGEKGRTHRQFGVGFYSAFMVAEKVDVISRRAGADTANIWSSDGKGAYTVGEIDVAQAPARGTRVVLHLNEDGKAYADRFRIERIVKEQSGTCRADLYRREAGRRARGDRRWRRPLDQVEERHFGRGLCGFLPLRRRPVRPAGADGPFPRRGPARIHRPRLRALHQAVRPVRARAHGRVKLYVKRVFITDDAELLPRYLRFVRGVVDSADLPLNLSREMLQDSAILAAIRKGVTGRVLTELEKLAQSDAEAYAGIWSNFGAVLKEGLYEDYERRAQLLNLARFKTTTSGTAADSGWRTLKDYVADLKENQTAIYYITGDLAAWNMPRSWKASAPVAWRCCCCPIRWTASG